MPQKTVEEAITSAKEWRRGREEGVLFHFPSGFLARVRTVNVGTFIRLGHIPDVLTSIVEKALRGDTDFDKLTIEELEQLQAIYDIYCETCFMEPKVVKENPTDDQLMPDDISDIDKQTLFTFMGAPASMLAEFRPYQADNVDDLDGQPGDSPSAE